MIGVDTNVLLRWIANDVVGADDARHQSILIEETIGASEEEIFVNAVVLAEAVWVLRRRVSKPVLVEVLTGLLMTANVVIADRDTVVMALDAFKQQSGDFPDHLIGEINRQQGCRTTFTFDRAAARSPHFSELQR